LNGANTIREKAGLKRRLNVVLYPEIKMLKLSELSLDLLVFDENGGDNVSQCGPLSD
jgi:hypothetical protein